MALSEESNYVVLYQQCNVHLIEGDKKRDQILVLFMSITGIYIANLDKLNSMNFVNILSLLMVLMGTIFSAVIIKYRKWHIKYALACIVIQRLMFTKDKDINQQYITNILKSVVKELSFKGFLKETETWILNLFLVINSINIYIFQVSLELNLASVYITIIIYFVVTNIIYYRSIKKLCNKKKIDSIDIWIIDLFGSKELY